VSVNAIRGTLKREGVTLRPPVPKYTKARMLQLLRDGFKASDVARMLDMSVNTVYHYAGKIKRMKRTISRLDAA
jgi:transposase